MPTTRRNSEPYTFVLSIDATKCPGAVTIIQARDLPRFIKTRDIYIVLPWVGVERVSSFTDIRGLGALKRMVWAGGFEWNLSDQCELIMLDNGNDPSLVEASAREEGSTTWARHRYAEQRLPTVSAA